MIKLTHDKFDKMVEQALMDISPVEGGSPQALESFLSKAKEIKAKRPVNALRAR